jgi:small conductance mechanosensitive channel
METNEAMRTAVASLTHVGLMVVGAIILLIIGRWLIAFAVRMITRSLEKQRVDPTLLRYVGNIVSVILNVALIVAILGYFGVETTTFAALLAAAGVAIGMAWSGLLANFAAGAFIVVLRPFKVGDFVMAGGVTGTVKEIGLFVTTINTLDNIFTIVGNNKVFSDNIQNFSTNAYRRVDLLAQLNHGSITTRRSVFSRSGSSKSRTCWPIRRRTSRFLRSISPDRCSRCARTAIPITIGKYTSPPTE